MQNTNDIVRKENSVNGSSNPYIDRKIKETEKAAKSQKRKSMIFSEDEYKMIVALSKVRGERYRTTILSLVEAEISLLSDIEKERYNKFLEMDK